MPTIEEKQTILEMLDSLDSQAWKALVAYMARDLCAEQDFVAEVSTARERRKWALEMSAALLRSDMDCFDPDEFEDEDEKDRRKNAVQKVADELEAKARRITLK